MSLSNAEKRAVLEEIVDDDAVVAYILGGKNETFGIHPKATHPGDRWQITCPDSQAATKRVAAIRCPGRDYHDLCEFTSAEGFDPIGNGYDSEPIFVHQWDEEWDGPRERHTLTQCVGYRVKDDADFREDLIDRLLKAWD